MLPIRDLIFICASLNRALHSEKPNSSGFYPLWELTKTLLGSESARFLYNLEFDREWLIWPSSLRGKPSSYRR